HPDDLGEQLGIRATAEGGVEVDEVDPLGAVALPRQRGLDRRPVGGLGAGLALDESHGLAVGDVDGGQQLESCHGGPLGHRVVSQLRSSSAPASPDFSGWNWVALSGPFSTAAANRVSPCVAHVVRTYSGVVRAA